MITTQNREAIGVLIQYMYFIIVNSFKPILYNSKFHPQISSSCAFKSFVCKQENTTTISVIYSVLLSFPEWNFQWDWTKVLNLN